MSVDPEYLTTEAAAAALGVRPATLYAYVSRGLIRSEPAGGRARRYHAADVSALRRRQRPGGPAVAAEEAVDFGAPVLDSAITQIRDGRLYYRGRDAAQLARGASLRDVAALLWDTGDAEIFAPENMPVLGRGFLAGQRAAAALPPTRRCLALLPMAATADDQALDLSAATVPFTGARMVRLLAAIVAGSAPSAWPIDTVLAEGWELGASARELLRAALILCADHELDVCAFAVRCVASARASLYNAVIAGIAALEGARDGGECERADAFLEDALEASDPTNLVSEHLQRGARLPGFGHPLYPYGDPRARLLLDLLMEQERPLAGPGRRIETAVAALTGRAPTLDFALALIRHALRLPPGSALAIVTLGRSLGWIAHAAEQYASPRAIRPRARYVRAAPP